MRTITTTRTIEEVVVSRTLPDGSASPDFEVEVELPITDPYRYETLPLVATQYAPDKLLVSYLVHDPDRYDLNPFESCDPWMSAPDTWGIDVNLDAYDLNACQACGCDKADHDPATNGGVDPKWWIGCDEFVPDDRRIVFAWVGDGHGPYIDYRLCDGPDDANSFLIFDDEWGEEVLADVRAAARNMLDEYCKWANGEVYTIVHADYRVVWTDSDRVEHYPSGVSYCNACRTKLVLMADEDEEGNVYPDEHVCLELVDCDLCSGYIGAKYAESVMRDEHEFHVVDVAK